MRSLLTTLGISRTVVTDPVPVPEARAIVPSLDADQRRLYIEKATEIGCVNGAVKREMLLALLAEMGLRVYDKSAVTKFLDQTFGRAKDGWSATWGWRPLRAADREKLVESHHDTNGQILKRQYHGAVPLPVLLTVERIAASVPDVHFYVSDRVSPSDGDPFLMVAAAGMEDLVIERWDEPNFVG